MSRNLRLYLIDMTFPEYYAASSLLELHRNDDLFESLLKLRYSVLDRPLKCWGALGWEAISTDSYGEVLKTLEAWEINAAIRTLHLGSKSVQTMAAYGFLTYIHAKDKVVLYWH